MKRKSEMSAGHKRLAFLRSRPVEIVKTPNSVSERFKVGDLWVDLTVSEAKGLEVFFENYDPALIFKSFADEYRLEWIEGRDRAIQKLRDKVGHPVAIFIDD